MLQKLTKDALKVHEGKGLFLQSLTWLQWNPVFFLPRCQTYNWRQQATTSFCSWKRFRTRCRWRSETPLKTSCRTIVPVPPVTRVRTAWQEGPLNFIFIHFYRFKCCQQICGSKITNEKQETQNHRIVYFEESRHKVTVQYKNIYLSVLFTLL